MLTILFVSLGNAGHVHPLLGIACALKRRNHRVVFATDKRWKGSFEKFGIEEQLYDEKAEVADEHKFDILTTKGAENAFEMLSLTPKEHLTWNCSYYKYCFESSKSIEKILSEIVSNVKPDVILTVNLVPYACLLKLRLPIVQVFTPNPLFAFKDEKLPPCFFGLPIDDRSDLNSKREASLRPLWNEINEYLRERNLPLLREYRLQHLSTNLNVYIYPQPLVKDYLRLCPLGDEWIGLDHSLRESHYTFRLPQNFKNEHEKLIFLSMGSLASNIFGLMSRLVKILAKCKHKITVVRGHFKENYKLADNMWGEAFLPQLEIIPIVDLVISHGGNNTFVETLYFGKPMIIMPLFADQFDNAQRAVEAKIGVKVNPFTVEENELLDAIEMILNDEDIVERVQNISKQIRESKSMDSLMNKIEQVAKNPKFPSFV
ncbi:glycosyl transferase-like protein [Dinothrombium tinctorium]|uniref:UDP-glucuronosyltransferase n=1 Tax=Dinothrombium tinctorium TaxID=1965070 RepID=A0A3S3PDM3_9ACAR|nr:glycosyl transferase-like protein [Dinothrombium tinctorium]RWS17314.1 glycosyl transferase-like protein [Dinothrombium tinctorium]